MKIAASPPSVATSSRVRAVSLNTMSYMPRSPCQLPTEDSSDQERETVASSRGSGILVNHGVFLFALRHIPAAILDCGFQALQLALFDEVRPAIRSSCGQRTESTPKPFEHRILSVSSDAFVDRND